MKKILFLLALPISLFAQKNAPGDQSVVTLTCKKMVNCEAIDSMTLYEPVGLGYRVVQRAKRTEDKSYTFQVPAGEKKFYAIGTTEAGSIFILLGDEPEVAVYGDCAKLEYSRAIGKNNLGYHGLKKRIEAMKQAEQDASTAWRMAAQNSGDARATAAEKQKVQKLEAQKGSFLDSLNKSNPLFGKIAALHLVPNPAALDKIGYTSEFEFVASEYFRNANLADPDYAKIPDLMAAFDQFARILSAMPAMAEKHKEWTQKWLDKFEKGTPAHRLALSGLVSGFQLANSPNYLEFGKLYMETYKANDNGESRRLDFDLNKNRTFMPGMEVPDLAGMTPEGGQYSLAQMRGKYVLIDFWASWCGPCRRETPNVKVNYEKYKDKGFDILGVSLDKTLEAWKGAIDADVIPWKHISDLKGWQSEHAKTYSVTSIPQTLLLDPQGKLIVRNLRGEQLGEKLKEIFGE